MSSSENKETDYLQYDSSIASKWWTSDAAGEAILQTSATGLSHSTPFLTIPEVFSKACHLHPDALAMRVEKKESWDNWSYTKYYVEVQFAAKALIALDLQQFGSLALYGFNSPYWSIALVAAMTIGAKSVGLYPSDTAKHVRYKLIHSGARIAVIEGQEHLEKVLEDVKDDALEHHLKLKTIVVWDHMFMINDNDAKIAQEMDIQVLTWPQFIARGNDVPEAMVQERASKVKSGHCAAIVYTSGTTGMPKGVMLSHDNLVYCCVSVMSLPGVCGTDPKGEERVVSYLPLSHIAGMMIDIIGPLVVAANVPPFKGSCSIHFARPDDLKTGGLVHRLRECKPTIFLGVPRVYEKIMEKMQSTSEDVSGMKKFMAEFARKRMFEHLKSKQWRSRHVHPFGINIAKMISHQVVQQLGFHHVKYFFSGAAPLSMEVIEYFAGIGININEGYGLSETTGSAIWSTDARHVWGSVGYEVPGVQIKLIQPVSEEGNGNREAKVAKDIFNATEEEQGEIYVRGRNVMMGYLANPDLGDEHVEEIKKENAETIDENGWLHTGDKATKDVRGMYRVTGRLKELIIGTGGENIAPVPIEDELKRLCSFVSNVIMIGNKRKFNVVLLTLDAEGATGESPGKDDLTHHAAKLLETETISETMESKKAIELITKHINEVNENQHVVPNNAAKIQKFSILPRDFSVSTGELTPTLKIKRDVVDEKFSEVVEAMYNSNSKEMYVKAPSLQTNGTLEAY